MISAQPRILVVDADKDVVRSMAASLHKKGIAVGAVADPQQAPAAAGRFGAGLILVELQIGGSTATPVIEELRRDPRTAHIPIAVYTSKGPSPEVLAALKAGAAAVFGKPFDPDADLAELDMLLALPRHAGTPFDLPLADRILRYAQRTAMDSVIVAASGHAVFKGGELTEAKADSLTGRPALLKVLEASEAELKPVKTDARQRPAPPPPPLELDELVDDVQASSPAPEAGRCLLVDDEPDLLRLFSAFLTRAGFEVSTAPDGLEGFEACVLLRPAIVVADLNMPRLDGWGLLRRIREDARVGEIPVVFLSAQDDYRESLRAIGAGAQDYLAKVSKMDHLARRVREALAPRERAKAGLAGGSGAHGRIEQLGVRWLLVQCFENKVSGTLACSDGFGLYNVGLDRGEAVFAATQAGDRRVGGEAALATVARLKAGDVQFIPGSAPPTTNLSAKSLPAILEKMAQQANEADEKMITQLMIQANQVEVDGPMFSLFERFCSEQSRQVAEYIRAGKTPRTIIAECGVSPVEVEETVRDLIRRKVISLKA